MSTPVDTAEDRARLLKYGATEQGRTQLARRYGISVEAVMEWYVEARKIDEAEKAQALHPPPSPSSPTDIDGLQLILHEVCQHNLKAWASLSTLVEGFQKRPTADQLKKELVGADFVEDDPRCEAIATYLLKKYALIPLPEVKVEFNTGVKDPPQPPEKT